MVLKSTTRRCGIYCPIINPSGMALVLCLLLMTTLCLVGGAALSVSGLNHKIVHNGAKQAQSFYLAEAGKELALSYLKEDPLWRGAAGTPPGFSGELMVDGYKGLFSVTVSDCTADDNGIYSAQIPAGYLLVESSGTWMDAFQSVSCLARIQPEDGSSAVFPSVAVASSGAVTGSLATLDEMGNMDTSLLQENMVLPAANENLLKALADMAFSSLDDDQFDAALTDVGDFWQDTPADTRPHVFYIQGDLTISGDRLLHGIVFVEGANVAFEDESSLQGVLYAPDATAVTFQNGGASGRIVVKGLVVVGPAGIDLTGNPVSFQGCQEYAAGFNDVAGPQVVVETLSGSWGRL